MEEALTKTKALCLSVASALAKHYVETRGFMEVTKALLEPYQMTDEEKEVMALDVDLLP